MAQFDVFRNPRRGVFPLLLDVQADLLARLSTCVVVPMARVAKYGAPPIARLNPTARVGGVDYILVVQDLAAVPRSVLGARVGSLGSRRADVVAALDLLLTGI